MSLVDQLRNVRDGVVPFLPFNRRHTTETLSKAIAAIESALEEIESHQCSHHCCLCDEETDRTLKLLKGTE